MISQFDQDKDGRINEQEFLSILNASDDADLS
jgi:Ca2+-binding EF-hand superfamily protein